MHEFFDLATLGGRERLGDQYSKVLQQMRTYASENQALRKPISTDLFAL